jgi:hypothetical protein
MTHRRNFIKNSLGMIAGTAFLPNFLTNGFEDYELPSFLRQKDLQHSREVLFGDPVLIVQGPDDIFIQAYRYQVDGGLLQQFKKNIHILCHELVLNEGIEVVNGKNISIFCYHLKSSKEVGIRSTGLQGEKAVKAPGAQGIGQAGEAGDNQIEQGIKVFVDGGDGGEVRVTYQNIINSYAIKVESIGGTGGKGEDGGNGYHGQAGEVGRNSSLGGAAVQGGQGQSGSKGGNGAVGGKGGHGKSVIITKMIVPGEISAPTHHLITAASKGGVGGTGGKGGDGGDGGPGGAGGRTGFMTSGGGGGVNGGGGIDRWHLNNGRVASGAQGPKGEDGKDGIKGLDGSQGIVTTSTLTATQVSALLSTPFIKLIQLKAQSLYMNNQFDEASELLVFLSALDESKFDNPTNQLYYNLCKFMFAGSKEAGIIIERAKRYALQLSLGLNFWGSSANYVPRIRKDYLKREIIQLIGIAKSFEDTLNTFYNEQTLKQDAFNAIQQSRNVLNQSLTLLKTNLDQKQTYTFIGLQKEIYNLNVDIEKKAKRLDRAENKFKDALKEKNKKKCGFKEVITCAQVIVSIGTAAASFGAGLAASVSAINAYNQLSATAGDTLKDQWGVVSAVGKIAKEAAGNMSTASNALDKIEDGISALFEKNKADATLSTSLIELEYEDFVKTMDKYIDMPEARAYKAEMRQYVNIINTRNKKRLEYTNNILEIQKAKNEIALIELDLGKTQDATVLAASRLAPGELQLMMVNQYLSVKGQMMRLLYLLNRSMVFFSLKNNNLIFHDASIASLQTDLIDTIVNGIEDDNALGNGLNEFKSNIVLLDEEKYPLSFKDFKANKPNEDFVLDFYIAPDEKGFQGEYAEIRIKNVRVFIDGLNCSSDKVSMKLEHLGNSLIRSRANKNHDFCHDIVPITLDYFHRKNDNQAYQNYQNNITGTFEDSQAKYTLVSPFANWRLTIRKDVNPSVNLNRIKRVRMLFDFYATPRSS